MNRKIAYDVLSPDGFSIHPTDYYKSKEEAKKALNEWVERYRHQGHYTLQTMKRIPIDELAKYCQIIPIDADTREVLL